RLLAAAITLQVSVQPAGTQMSAQGEHAKSLLSFD
ncbi:MAG: hypothetical protein ACI9K8_000198, partial [Reinekea sp.]